MRDQHCGFGGLLQYYIMWELGGMCRRLKRRGIIIESPASVAFVTHPVIFCLKWSEVVFARPWSVSYSFSFELEGVSFSL